MLELIQGANLALRVLLGGGGEQKHAHRRSEVVKTALVLVPGLLCDQRLWQHQVENLGDLAEPVVANVTGSDTIDGLAHTVVLRAAPDRFFLARAYRWAATSP